MWWRGGRFACVSRVTKTHSHRRRVLVAFTQVHVLGFFLVVQTTVFRCGPCDVKCESCTGPNADQCITCKSGYFELNGTCHGKCPDYYYSDQKRHECLACPTGCVACNSTSCHSCEEGFALNKKGRCLKTGSQQCQPGKWGGGKNINHPQRSSFFDIYHPYAGKPLHAVARLDFLTKTKRGRKQIKRRTTTFNSAYFYLFFKTSYLSRD